MCPFTSKTSPAKLDASHSSPRCVTSQPDVTQPAVKGPTVFAARRVDVTDLRLARAPRPHTICAACGVEDAAAHCGRCRLAYCGQKCQRRHWKSGGHRERCDHIQRFGVDQYIADAQATASRERAVATCMTESRGKACGFCGEHGNLIRACRGCETPEGFFHVECLKKHATAVAARDGARHERFEPWFACSRCGDEFSGLGQLCVAREAWRTYQRLHPTTIHRVFAMNNLGDALARNGLHRECLSVREDELSVGTTHFPNHVPQIEANLARCYTSLGRKGDALQLRRRVFAALHESNGPCHRSTLDAQRCLAQALGDADLVEERRTCLRQLWPRCKRVLGRAHATTLSCGAKLASSLVDKGHAAPDATIAEAEDILDECAEAALNELGADHATTLALERSLDATRWLYLADEGPRDE